MATTTTTTQHRSGRNGGTAQALGRIGMNRRNLTIGSRGTDSGCRPTSGFTLVELLVGMGILALLVAILAPAAAAVRREARLLQCVSNLRQLGQAMRTYALRSDGWMPRDAFSASNAFFAPLLARDLGVSPPEQQTMTIAGRSGPRVQIDLAYCMDWLRPLPQFKCPAVNGDEHVLHYVINEMDFNWYAGRNIYRAEPWQKLESARNPAQVALFAEANLVALAPGQLGQYNFWRPTHLPYFNPPNVLAGQPTPSSPIIAAGDGRHGGRTALVYFDGHADIRSLRSAGDWGLSVLNPYAIP
jgi:prepilin-type N-terminal cleavage/methylation domain-containing protein/prepilin-type processing-associated H-X9-DG protein